MVLAKIWLSFTRICSWLVISVIDSSLHTIVYHCLLDILSIRGLIDKIQSPRLSPPMGRLCLQISSITQFTLFFSDLSFFRDSKNVKSPVDFPSITGRVSNNGFTVIVFDRGVIWEGMFSLKLSLSRTDAFLHLFTALARFWLFVMFDKSFRISLDFIKEQVRQETQTFVHGADKEDKAMKCEFSYLSYSQSEDNAQDFREEIDGQHEYEGVVIRADGKLQYDKSTGIASCAAIMRQKVPMKRQAPPDLWTKYNDDLWPEDQRIQKDVILECVNSWTPRENNQVDDCLVKKPTNTNSECLIINSYMSYAIAELCNNDLYD